MDLTLFTHFAANNTCGTTGFFGFPTWYSYIPQADFTNCSINSQFKIPGDLLYIGVAAIDIALYIAGLVAVGFVIYGGILYVTSQGDPNNTKNAKNTILNALVGVVVASIAVAAVSFIGNSLT